VSLKFLTLGLMTLVLTANAAAQDPHVFSDHKKQLKATLVYTDKMYLLRSGAQTIDAEFNFRLNDKATRPQPERVDLQVTVTGLKPRYEKSRAADLLIVVDGIPLRTEKILYLVLHSDNSIPFERVKPFVAGNRLDPTSYLEMITVYLDPQEAKKMTKARSVKLRIGKDELAFSEVQMNTVRDFAARIP
jgi:hypothetical protein